MKASKLELWWWLIFNHKKFDRWISVNESIVRENTTQKLEREFEEKLEFLTYKDKLDMMLSSGFEYPVLQVPIHNPHLRQWQSDPIDRVSPKVDVYHQKELMSSISFCSEINTIEYIKRQASNNLAEVLIKKGLLKSRFWRNGPETVVEFYVNIYQK